MCGRYSMTAPLEVIEEAFGVAERPNFPPRYNIAPTQEAPVIRMEADGQRHLRLLSWGLVPFWAGDTGIGTRLINARAESAATKPAFRAAFHKRRCLVLADGFYEWRKPATTGGRKQPYRVTRADGAPFAFAGLWESWWAREDEAPVETFTILTTDANATLAPIHERMPVVLASAAVAAWLDPATAGAAVQALLRPLPDGEVRADPVSTRINKVANDDPGLVDPVPLSSDTGASRAAKQGRLL